MQVVCMGLVNDWEEQSSRHKQEVSKHAFEQFSDIIKMLQPFPSTKMTWHSDFIIAVILLHSAILFSFPSGTARLVASHYNTR